MPTPFIRIYDPSRDFENGLHVFLTTIDPALDSEPARTIGSHLWYTPYVTLTPSTCIVLDDGTGVVVGYCIGAAHTVAFAQRWRDEFAPSVDQKRVPRPETSTDDPRMEKDGMRDLRDAVYSAHCSMLLDWPETLEKYLAHLHIDILPGYQRRGFGKKLIHAFFDEVKKCGAEGVHLDMVRHNVSGRAFYDKVGFEVCDQILDGGESGETGVNGIVVTLVKRL